MSARLFVAIDLTDDARERITVATGRLRRALAASGMERAFRWVAPANLHLTLRFLGAVDDGAVPGVASALARDLDVLPGSIRLERPGTFPRAGRPRVLHVPVSQGADLLLSLRERVDARLAPVCTWEAETRPFAPHLTLARTRDRAALDVAAFRASLDAAVWPVVAMDVARITLFESVTRPSGPEYSVRAQAALRSR